MTRVLTTLALIVTLSLAARGGAADKIEPLPTPEPAKAAPKRLTLEEVGKMMEGLGYNPTPLKDKDGKLTSYEVNFKSGTWTMAFKVSLSSDNTNVWFSAYLGDLPTGTTLPADVIVKLLEHNRTMYPAYFHCYASNRALCLSMPVANADLTPGVIREKVDAFSDLVKQTEPLWNTKKWAPSTTTQAAPAPAPLP